MTSYTITSSHAPERTVDGDLMDAVAVAMRVAALAGDFHSDVLIKRNNKGYMRLEANGLMFVEDVEL